MPFVAKILSENNPKLCQITLNYAKFRQITLNRARFRRRNPSRIAWVWIPWTWRRSLGAKSQKVSKKSRKTSRPRGPKSPKKVSKKVRKVSKKSENGFLETFRTFFEIFFGLLGPMGREAPGDFFETFWLLAPRLLLPGPRNTNPGWMFWMFVILLQGFQREGASEAGGGGVGWFV